MTSLIEAAMTNSQPAQLPPLIGFRFWLWRNERLFGVYFSREWSLDRATHAEHLRAGYMGSVMGAIAAIPDSGPPHSAPNESCKRCGLHLWGDLECARADHARGAEYAPGEIVFGAVMAGGFCLRRYKRVDGVRVVEGAQAAQAKPIAFATGDGFPLPETLKDRCHDLGLPLIRADRIETWASEFGELLTGGPMA